MDPAVTATEDSDETGIIVAAAGNAPDGVKYPLHYYIIDDLSMFASPETWARAVVMALRRQQADRTPGCDRSLTH